MKKNKNVLEAEKKLALAEAVEDLDSAEASLTRLNDTANAILIRHLFGDKLRFDHLRKRWLVWSGHRWESDKVDSVEEMAVAAARHRWRDAATIKDSTEKLRVARFAVQSEESKRIATTLKRCRSLPGLADDGGGWDNNPWLLGFSNGVVDLRTGKLRPGKPSDGVTMTTGVEFHADAKCPRFEKFVDEIFNGDKELVDWLHRALGYTVTGKMGEQVIFLGFGSGKNGKSTLLNIVSEVMGDYSYKAPSKMFLATRSENTSDQALAEKSRFIFSSEFKNTAHLNEELLKSWSGGDPQRPRRLYQDFDRQFRPVGKIWMFANQKPTVDDDSLAFWRRVRAIPFTQTFDVDESLSRVLVGEKQGIAAWLVRGCLEWRKRGLRGVPKAVTAFTRDYQEEADPVGEFLIERCVVGEKAKEKASTLYAAYVDWATLNRLRRTETLTRTKFGRLMGQRFIKVRNTRGLTYYGISLRVGGEALARNEVITDGNVREQNLVMADNGGEENSRLNVGYVEFEGISQKAPIERDIKGGFGKKSEPYMATSINRLFQPYINPTSFGNISFQDYLKTTKNTFQPLTNYLFTLNRKYFVPFQDYRSLELFLKKQKVAAKMLETLRDAYDAYTLFLTMEGEGSLLPETPHKPK